MRDYNWLDRKRKPNGPLILYGIFVQFLAIPSQSIAIYIKMEGVTVFKLEVTPLRMHFEILF